MFVPRSLFHDGFHRLSVFLGYLALDEYPVSAGNADRTTPAGMPARQDRRTTRQDRQKNFQPNSSVRHRALRAIFLRNV